MARDFARAFYHSAAWARAKAYVRARSHRLCERCAAAGRVTPARIVHHKVPLTPTNIGDPRVALDPENLIDVCMDCHAVLHGERPEPIRPGLAFDEAGNVVRVG